MSRGWLIVDPKGEPGEIAYVRHATYYRLHPVTPWAELSPQKKRAWAAYEAGERMAWAGYPEGRPVPPPKVRRVEA